MRRLIVLAFISTILLIGLLSCTSEPSLAPLSSPRPIHTAPKLIPSPAPSPAPTLPERTQATVVRVIDGDTIEVEISGSMYKVRYIGVDTPEENEVGYEVATLVNELLVKHRVVELEKDVSETDKYGRLLRYVWVEEGMVNAILVTNGYAQVATYPPDVKYQEDFLKLQRDAQRVGLGLWAALKPS